MTDGPPSAEFLADAAYFIRITQIFFCYAVTLWDWFVGLPREYRFIWKQHWTSPKFLYIGCRYWVIIIMPVILWINTNESHSKEDCAVLYNIPPLLAMWNQLFAECVLLVRTHAFLGQRKAVLVFLVLSLTAVGVYQLYVALEQMAPLPFVVAPFERGPCLPTVRYRGSAHIMGWFLAPLLFDTVVTLLTVWHAIQIRRAGGGTGSPILQTFLREGLYYFVLISAANLINGIFNFQPKESMSAMVVPLSLVLPDVIACRLILDLREQGQRTPSQSYFTSSTGRSSQWTKQPRTTISNAGTVRGDFNENQSPTVFELATVGDKYRRQMDTDVSGDEDHKKRSFSYQEKSPETSLAVPVRQNKT